MQTIDTFVSDARNKGLADDTIKKTLVEHGWSETTAESALLGLAVPEAPVSEVAESAHQNQPSRPSISPLEAALHHIFLWVFTATSSIMIGIVTTSVFGEGLASSEPLLTYLVVELVTFLPFVILFTHYLRQFNKNQDLTTGKIWSIITIVFHSLGAMGSLVGFLLSLILVPSHSGSRTPALIASAAIGVMNIAVLTVYVLANFTKSDTLPMRKKLLYTFPALLFLIISIFGILALMHVGPLRSDDQTRNNLVETVGSIKTYTEKNDKLPPTLAAVGTTKGGITYKKDTTSTYSLCADFKVDTKKGPQPALFRQITDAYIAASDFQSVQAGQTCFTIEASSLASNYTAPYDLPIYDDSESQD